MPNYQFLTENDIPTPGLYILKLERPKCEHGPLIFEIEVTDEGEAGLVLRYVDNTTTTWAEFKSCLAEPTNMTFRKEIYGM